MKRRRSVELGPPAASELGGSGGEPQAQGGPDPGQAEPMEAQDQRGHRNVRADGEDHRAAHRDVVGDAEDEAVQDEGQRGQGLGPRRDQQGHCGGVAYRRVGR